MKNSRGLVIAALKSMICRGAKRGATRGIYLQIALVFGLLLVFDIPARGDVVNTPWQQPDRGCRMLLDWRASDRRNASEPTEVFFDLAKLSATSGCGPLTGASFTCVAENGDGSCQVMPFASREELGRFGRHGTVFRFVPPPQAKDIWMYFGGPDRPSPAFGTQWNLLEGCFDAPGAWNISDRRVSADVVRQDGSPAMIFKYRDKGEPADPTLHVAITRSFSIPSDCRGAETKVSFDVKANCQGYVPFTILLQQFDANGKVLDACVVDPRWLSICLASGQDVQLREQGFIYAATTSIKMTIGLWCPQSRDPIMNFDGSLLGYPASDDFDVTISKAELRAAHPIEFPGFERSNYAPGISGEADDQALVLSQGSGFCFDANPRSVWSEGALPANPRAYNWPSGAGTFECWFFPQWNPGDSSKRYLLDAMDGIGALDRSLQIYYIPSMRELEVIRRKCEPLIASVDLKPGGWHHFAYTWDPGTKQQAVFIDGVMLAKNTGQAIEAIDVSDLDSSKHMPGRVWLGQSSNDDQTVDEALHGRLDEVRISDGLRYVAPFTPRRAAFTVDDDTRALFHFDGRIDGINSSDRDIVQGSLLSPLPQVSADIEYQKQGSGETTRAAWTQADLPDANNPLKLFDVNFYQPLTESEFEKSSVDHEANFHLKPGESAQIRCDSQPYMDWVELRCPDAGKPLGRPFVAKDGEIDPRTVASMLKGLGIDKIKSQREKADAIFQYLVAHNDYFWAPLVEISPFGRIYDPGDYSSCFLNGFLEEGCGEQNRTVRDCFLAAGLSADSTHGSAHVFEQVFFDGSWHIYDLFARIFFPARDNARPACIDEIERDPYLAVRMDKPDFGYWLPSDTRIYQFPDRELAMPDMAYQLRPGESFRYYWHNDGRYNPLLINDTDHCVSWKNGPKLHGRPLHWTNHFPPYFANGVCTFSCTPREDHPALSDWHDGSFIYKFYSPFVVCGARVKASSGQGGVAAVEISYDQGASWTATPPADNDGASDLNELCLARHAYWLRVTPPGGGRVASFQHRAIVLMNPKVLTPVLSQGDNTLHFTAQSGGECDMSVHYHEIDEAPLEIVGGCRFGWVEGHPRQLLVCKPAESVTFDVRGAGSQLSVAAPAGVKTSVQPAHAGDWHVELQVPADFSDGLFPLSVNSDGRVRSAAILIARGARLVPAESAARRGNITAGSDPNGIHGPVLSLSPGSEADFPLSGDGAGPLALFALANIPENPHSQSTLLLASGPAPMIEPNYAHEFWVQTNLLYQWKWYHVRAGGYPFQTFAAVNLADPDTAAISCTQGQTLLSAVLVLPARDEKLVESVTQYLFSGNYDPWMFNPDWGPLTTGAPYPLK
jgi:hypothetical protein